MGARHYGSPFLIFRQSKLARLNHEHRELKEKLKEERRQTEELWKTKTHLEDERRLQDRTVEQLQRKVENLQISLQAETDKIVKLARFI